MNRELIDLMQMRIANSSVGPSTVRGMGPAGTIEAARAFLREFDIKAIKSRSEPSFRKNLDQVTKDLMGSLPRGGRHWGSSRKVLNIFLRNCLYNRYLCDQYQLYVLEDWLEVPLDSHVGKGLKLADEGKQLPSWNTVIGLTPEVSEAFQGVALSVAAKRSVARVHLDILYWRGAHMAHAISMKRAR